MYRGEDVPAGCLRLRHETRAVGARRGVHRALQWVGVQLVLHPGRGELLDARLGRPQRVQHQLGGRARHRVVELGGVKGLAAAPRRLCRRLVGSQRGGALGVLCLVCGDLRRRLVRDAHHVPLLPRRALLRPHRALQLLDVRVFLGRNVAPQPKPPPLRHLLPVLEILVVQIRFEFHPLLAFAPAQVLVPRYIVSFVPRDVCGAHTLTAGDAMQPALPRFLARQVRHRELGAELFVHQHQHLVAGKQTHVLRLTQPRVRVQRAQTPHRLATLGTHARPALRLDVGHDARERRR
mmetsp:Transcript_14126/g.34177  ORF Transcript_14126/g.34177 Transcript_14126/m.34177 type:complete len:293 (+) Transcript_14126:965-1843(+)